MRADIERSQPHQRIKGEKGEQIDIKALTKKKGKHKSRKKRGKRSSMFQTLPLAG